MKKIKLLANGKTNYENMFFYGCRWSIFIIFYVMITVIIVFYSNDYFKEGIFAADIACISSGSKDVNQAETDSLEEQDDDLNSKAAEENQTAVNAFVQYGTKTLENNINQNELDSATAEQMVVKLKLKETEKVEEETAVSSEAKETIATEQQEPSEQIKLSTKEKTILQRIVEAEASGESIKGKMLVANVVLNRVNSSKFPNSIEGVVFQKNGSVYQFSPIKDGRYYTVTVSEETKDAVNRVLNGEDDSQGALFFMSRSKAMANSVTWFDTKLVRVFKYGTHEFYK